MRKEFLSAVKAASRGVAMFNKNDGSMGKETPRSKEIGRPVGSSTHLISSPGVGSLGRDGRAQMPVAF